MKDAQKPDHVTLNQLLARLREGRYVIPDFQREFEWQPWDILELLRSVFLDYYIGSLLLWKGTDTNFAALSCEPIYGYAGEGARPEFIVLDGQQRLTALHYAFFAPDVPLPNRANRASYYVRVDRLMEGEHDEAFHYEWISKRWRKLLGDPERQYKEHVFPLSVVGEEGWALPNWVQGYEQYWKDRADEADSEAEAQEAREHAANARDFGTHVRELTEQYRVSYIELDKDIGIEKVCDIFTQINSRGVRLDVFDLINALLKPKGIQLKHMWREAAPRLEQAEASKMNVYILQVMSILRQAYCSPKYLYFLMPGQEKPVRDADGKRRKEVLVPTSEDFRRRWDEAVAALQRAIRLLQHPQEFGAISAKYLPYVSILPVFAAVQELVAQHPAEERLEAQRKARHWYWASVFTNRYSGSVESTAARDFLDVRAWLGGSEPPALIEEFKRRFRDLDLHKEVRRGTSVYNGVFNLLVLNGARDWASGTVPEHDDLDDHHIIPSSWGAKHLGGNLIHTIANRTPLTSQTNRHVIADRLPNEYLPELMEKNGEDAVRAVLASHLISDRALEILLRDPFGPEDFEAFVTERQQTIQDAIGDLLVKERLDLPPRLRELDEAVERVELGVRQLVADALDDDPAELPEHVRSRVADRVQRALRKNAALDAANYDALSGQLEFFDFRELENTITNKTLWPRFADAFGRKEAVVAKFDQVAELRNAIRHSRTVDEVVRKEGEAAILWFDRLLAPAIKDGQEIPDAA